MPRDTKKQKPKKHGESFGKKDGLKKPHDKGPTSKTNSRSRGTSLGLKFSHKKRFDRSGEGKANAIRRRNIVKKAILQKTKSFKRQLSSSSLKDVPATIRSKNGTNCASSEATLQKVKRRKKRNRRKGNLELDEASRLQRRTRYLLIKVRQEQNLIDAYSAEGWKGQSREKIKPEKELERAKKQILNCKLGIREVIHQLDLLSSEGHIDDSAVAPDGSVHHEHIICAKCELREAFPDNDIILCDGTCNCAFHQKCLDPPLSTENIPPGDEGWFCRYCKCKMEILEATNVHLGTTFAMDSNWQDIFVEETMLPEGGESLRLQEQEWPSEDSKDDDYDPENSESSCNRSMDVNDSNSSDSSTSSSSLRSLEDDTFFLLEQHEDIQMGYEDHSTGVESDGMTDCEVLCQPRQRKSVDYIKLNDELFGKSAPVSEQISEDEDWGPTKRIRRIKESDAVNTPVISVQGESNCSPEKTTEVRKRLLGGTTRRPIFRFPRNAVEKLRLVFAENELPSRTIRENLSRQLGLESEKVNKWFKNARYLALKYRKKVESSDCVSSRNEPKPGSGKDKPAGRIPSTDTALLLAVDTPKVLKKSSRKQAACLVTSTLRRKRKQHGTPLGFSPHDKKASVDFGDDVSLKLLREKVRMEKKLSFERKNSTSEAEAEMERLCRMKDKVEKLQQILLTYPNGRTIKSDLAALDEPSVVYVPVAVLKEKRVTV